MFTKLCLFATTAVLLSPIQLLAGGPPLLCLPIDGVTEANASAFVKRVTDGLGERADKVELRRNEDRWYAMITFQKEISLGDCERALKDSPFSIHRENLHLFGHVVLNVKIDEADAKRLIDDLKRMKFVAVEEATRTNDRLRVTVEMPYPPFFGSQRRDFWKEPFSKLKFGSVVSDLAPRYDSSATARELPGYQVFRATIEKNRGSLTDVGWDVRACRVLGGIAVVRSE